MHRSLGHSVIVTNLLVDLVPHNLTFLVASSLIFCYVMFYGNGIIEHNTQNQVINVCYIFHHEFAVLS